MKPIFYIIFLSSSLFVGTVFGQGDQSESGYGMCIRQGYSPSSCDKNGKIGYGICIEKGYSPASCNPAGDEGYGECISAGYSPSSC